MVAAQEDVPLPRVPRRQGRQEINDAAGVGASVAVVAEEDYGGGFELGSVDAAFEVRPQVLQLRYEAVDVAHADYYPAFWGL